MNQAPKHEEMLICFLFLDEAECFQASWISLILGGGKPKMSQDFLEKAKKIHKFSWFYFDKDKEESLSPLMSHELQIYPCYKWIWADRKPG